jgi:hypothetical protein
VSAVLWCAACDARYPWRDPRTTCACGGWSKSCTARTARAAARCARPSTGGSSATLRSPGSGVWRFRELLLPGRGATVAHPEGNTRIYRREAVSRYTGVADLG